MEPRRIMCREARVPYVYLRSRTLLWHVGQCTMILPSRYPEMGAGDVLASVPATCERCDMDATRLVQPPDTSD